MTTPLPTERQAVADRLRAAYDVQPFPELKYWNYGPCPNHVQWTDSDGVEHYDEPKSGCRQCGVHPRRHQRVGSTWLYAVKRGLLADTVGSGKTFHAALLLAMMKERGELDERPAIVVVRSSAVTQWQRELARVIPRINVAAAIGTKNERAMTYSGLWEVLLIGQHMLLRDIGLIDDHFKFQAVLVDDVDALRHPETQTSYAINRLAREADRCVVMTGTPLQKKLEEIHSVLLPLGGTRIFGSKHAFEKRYVRTEPQTIWVQGRGQRRNKVVTNRVVGYKNIEEFKRLIAPVSLRRIASDIDDVQLPALESSNIFLDLHPRQRAAYKELQGETRDLRRSAEFREASALVQRTQVGSKLHAGGRICAALSAHDPEQVDTYGQTSVKLDWLMDQFGADGDLGDEKGVVFIHYKPVIRVLVARLQAAGIGHVTYSGDDMDKERRQASIDRFWEDPTCRLLIGTTAIEQSLNLQVARHLVNVDMIPNPARMEQLAGRIRRDGSAFKTVYVHNLITNDTHEERYLPSLEREQAVINVVWNESSELFAALNPLALAELITG